METKTCPQCLREFKFSIGDRHSLCGSCRVENRKKQCDCGALMQEKSITCASCTPHLKGESNGHWKGGRTRHKAGYVMLRVLEHPRVSKGGNPYVFEHILVMEKILGRYLYPEENVHHLNGVRDDNRPENLELWTRPQPSGIRASDAITWAKEILARYEGSISSNAQGN